jgi:hypothetical protein
LEKKIQSFGLSNNASRVGASSSSQTASSSSASSNPFQNDTDRKSELTVSKVKERQTMNWVQMQKCLDAEIKICHEFARLNDVSRITLTYPITVDRQEKEQGGVPHPSMSQSLPPSVVASPSPSITLPNPKPGGAATTTNKRRSIDLDLLQSYKRQCC